MSDDGESPAPPRWYGTDRLPPVPSAPGASSPPPPADGGQRWTGEVDTGVPAGGEPQASALGSDASARQVARAARAAFLSPELLGSRMGLWPWGRRARARRERNREVIEEARRRRGQFRVAFDSGPAPASAPTAGWRPVERRTNAAVIACLVGVVLGVFLLSVWFSGRTPAQHPQPAAGAAVLSGSGVAPSEAPPTSSSGGVLLPPQPPIPPGGVAPITPPAATTVNPASVRLVDPPGGEATAAELSSPEGAVRAWLARWCPYSHTEAFGVAEQRARSAMTASGWAGLDPAHNERARQSWGTVVAEALSARCSAPTALVSPEAPRSGASVIVIGQIQRVITAGGGARWVDTLTVTRVVLRGADGLWRVDAPTTGG